MYKVGINGVEKEVEAHGMSVESGTIIFFEDEDRLTSKLVVAAGKWDYFEVVGDPNRCGQRIEDKIEWCEEFLRDYAPQKLKEAKCIHSQ